MGRDDVSIQRITGQQLLEEWRDNLGHFGGILWSSRMQDRGESLQPGRETDIQKKKDEQSDANILFGTLEDGWYLIRAAYYEAGDCTSKLLCCCQGGERS
jgi:hypothetical protein